MSCVIAPITAEDIPGFHAALDCVAKEKIYLAFNAAPPLESTRAFVLGNLEKGHAQVVARDGATVVGWCDVIPPGNRDTNRHVGVLGLGVLPAYRGRGIGKKLMQAAIDSAFAKGLTRIELTVREKNANALALYKKLGFETEGLKKNSSFVNGAYENDYIMALLK